MKFGGHLDNSNMTGNNMNNLIFKIEEYVTLSKGLKFVKGENSIIISQLADNKKTILITENVVDVLQREDVDQRKFLQVNFSSGQKILLTDTLIGFKPVHIPGLDLSKIPKVVTTPDLKSVFEAIEESLSSDSTSDFELEVLKKVFLSILSGAESIGFDLSQDRLWYSRICSTKFIACA